MRAKDRYGGGRCVELGAMRQVGERGALVELQEEIRMDCSDHRGGGEAQDGSNGGHASNRSSAPIKPPFRSSLLFVPPLLLAWLLSLSVLPDPLGAATSIPLLWLATCKELAKPASLLLPPLAPLSLFPCRIRHPLALRKVEWQDWRR